MRYNRVEMILLELEGIIIRTYIEWVNASQK